VAACFQCGAQLPATFLACPSCGRLKHSDTLNQQAKLAQEALKEGDFQKALFAWRSVLDLLPVGSLQYEKVQAMISGLSQKVDVEDAKGRPSEKGSKKLAAGGAAGVALAFLAKFKIAILFFLGKAKVLLMGLTKVGTLMSMLVSLGVYWTVWGWKFALGLVVSIYIHEMGHVAMLHRYGMQANAPMFIPGVGAFVRMKQAPTNSREESRTGLAGPVWGLGAALASYLLYLASGQPFWAAIAHTGAWINLFNLMPIHPLDGGRGFQALSHRQKIISVVVMGVLWCITKEGLLVLMILLTLFKTVQKTSTLEHDNGAFFEYLFLLVTLSVLCKIPVPVTKTIVKT